jgi:tartrate dehydratase alpha subunit/fumarate hydratase class I-like protein
VIKLLATCLMRELTEVYRNGIAPAVQAMPRPPCSPAALHIGTSGTQAPTNPVQRSQYMQECFDRMSRSRGTSTPTGSRQPVDPSSCRGALHRRMIQPDSIWRLRANSSSRRDRAPGCQDTNSPQIATSIGRVSRTISPTRIPANNDSTRRKADHAINVRM